MTSTCQYPLRRVSVLIFFLLFFAAGYFHQPVEYDNTLSRYFLLSSMVDHGTFSIDAYGQGTIDKSAAGGRHYSNKAPGASVLGVPLYALMRALPTGNERPPLSGLEMYLVRIATTTIPFALLGVVMFRMACAAGARPRRALLAVLAYGLGSIALLHGMLYSGHQLAAGMGFSSFALLFHASRRADAGAGRGGVLCALTAGLMAGFAGLTDFTALMIALLLTGYALWLPLGRGAKVAFLGGGALCALLLAGYNHACFGSPFTMSYDLQTFGLFKQGASAGLFGITWPSPEALAMILASPARGLFFISPVLLLSLAGMGELCRRRALRRECLLMAAVVVAYLLFNSAYYCWHAGWTFGPRLLVPMLPFLALPMAFGRWGRAVFTLLLVPSVLQVWPAVMVTPHVSEEIRNPLVEFIFPCLQYGYAAESAGTRLRLPGIVSVVVWLLLVGVLAWMAWRALPPPKPAESRPRLPAAAGIALAVWVAVIAFALAAVRTPQRARVHHYRARVLGDAARVTRSPELMQAAFSEVCEAQLRAREPREYRAP